jgi:V/A-type H+-transporting ATPase subunit E
MKGLESGKDKVKKICEVLKKETIEPAQKEAKEMLEEAESRANAIIFEAHEQARIIEQEAKKEIEKERNVFQSSLNQACKQTLEYLKQEIENHLFHKELAAVITKTTQDPQVLAQLVEALIMGIQKEGLETDLSAFVSSAVSPSAINSLLGHNVLSRLKEQAVIIGPMQGGVAIKLHKDNITLDMTDIALKELVARYIRKDFRSMIFATS